MFNKNDLIEVEVIDLGENGEGIGKIDNFTLFIHGGVPGDIVEAKIIKVKKQYAIAKVEKFISQSAFRITPECPYLNCGGCQTQMISYNNQLTIKKQLVQSTLERIGGFKSIKVNEVLGMVTPFNYRNKSQFPIRDIDGKLHIGFFKQRTHDVVDIESCMVQHDLVNKVMIRLRELFIKFSISAYNEEKHTGYLRHVVTRISYKTSDMMLIFVTNGYSTEDELLVKIINELSEEFVEIKSYIQNINKSKGNRVLGFENKTLKGSDKIIDYIEELSFEISPLSFLQVNPIQTEKLYSTALKMLNINKDDTVFDIYCGIGTISLFLAEHAKKVYGVEIVDVAIQDAKKNADNNNLTNTEFIVGKAEEVIPELYKNGVVADIVVVDPPRKGCEEPVLRTILEMEPKMIAYVSCKVSTLARDLKILSEKYEVIEVQPVDLFPHTTHVETVVKLKLLK